MSAFLILFFTLILVLVFSLGRAAAINLIYGRERVAYTCFVLTVFIACLGAVVAAHLS